MGLWDAGAFWSALAGALAGAVAALVVGPFVARRGLIRQKRLEIYDDLIRGARGVIDNQQMVGVVLSIRKAAALAGRYEQKSAERLMEKVRTLHETKNRATDLRRAGLPEAGEVQQGLGTLRAAVVDELDRLEEYLRKKI